MSAGRLLPSQYRSFLRLLNTFNREQIPLLRVSNIAVATEYLDPRTSVRATFRSQQSLSSSSASGLLARLEDQLKILQHAEDHTREAFRTWQSLINRYGQVQLSPLTVCSAIEDAALALPAVASGEPAWSILDTLEEATDEENGSEATSSRLDELAHSVREQLPAELFKSAQDLGLPAHDARQCLELQYLHKVLVKELKYIEKPFEWAYEGLAPLLLRDVLEAKKGFSFSLAILFSCIARRLGICLTPVPVSQIDTGMGQSIAGPDLSRWLLRHDGMVSDAQTVGGMQPFGTKQRLPRLGSWYWDPVKGDIRSTGEVRQQFPKVGNIAGKGAVLTIWTEMLRLAVVAHQRRGDSDAVAHCLHQLLALDLTDPGWDAMLKS